MSVLTAWLLAVAAPAAASLGSEVDVDMRYSAGATMMNRMLAEDDFWSDAHKWEFDDAKHWYDRIMLKPVDHGYVPMISGEGSQDLPHDVVADIVFSKMNRLPLYMSGAKAVHNLGGGYDERIGAPYQDSFFFLDLTLFYVTYSQRMYRKHDEETGQTFLWFEKLTPDFVDAETWKKYQAATQKVSEGVDKRWAFGSILEIDQIYGMFIVGKGRKRESRVTFVSKLAFGDDAGFIAKAGSQMKSVLKAGLKSGFVASVNIANFEHEKRSKKK
jgi:hypothetical protein